jgi:predicted nucleotidyltransferase component of viral defense system
MMDKEDIEAYRTYKDRYQVEKDYLQDLILYSMCSSADTLVFKGGTAMSKFYNSDRFSEDLDFTAKIDEAGVKVLIDGAMASIQYPAAYLEKPTVNKFGTIEAEITIQGPRYNRKASTLQHIAFEINTSAILAEKAIPMARAPIYQDAKNYVALVMDRREILAEKVRAMMSKGRKHKERDLYDMYYLFGKGTPIDNGVVLKKLNEAKISFSKEELLKNIEHVKATWGSLQPFVQHTLEDYGYVSKAVMAALEKNKVL